eukprot:TRINITY_DN6257_c0_g2_i1.p1 TRINITY_DN6257_c0_g2~~TRINITY_DN6257_c0_g2_i1.p1  ORF type:complete len:489 (+),score=91.64 TRINITY_DN6257_c0_g2_i1:1132-2598(+)
MAALVVFLGLATAGSLGCCKNHPTVKAGILPATREPWWRFHGEDYRCGDKTRPCSEVSCKACWSGLVPDLHARLSEFMGYEYELVPAPPGATDAELLKLLEDGVVTMLPHELAPSSFTPEMKANFVTTQPFVSFTYSAMVRADTTDNDMWSIFEPFALEVWMAILTVVVVLSFVFWVLESNTKDISPKGLARGVDFVMSSLLGGMEYDGVRRDGRVGRFLRVGFLFFILIVTATYTANLASILTAKKVALNGPRDMQQLKTSRVCNFDRTAIRQSISEHARVVVQPDGPSSLWEATAEGRKSCLDKLADKSVDAVVANVLELKQMQRDFGFCTQVKHIPEIAFNPRYVVMLMTAANKDLAQNVTEAIVGLQTNKLLMSMMEDNYGSACTYDNTIDIQIKMQHLWGLFIIIACFAGVAIVVRSVAFLFASSSADVKSEPPDSLELLQRIAADVETLLQPGYPQASLEPDTPTANPLDMFPPSKPTDTYI